METLSGGGLGTVAKDCLLLLPIEKNVDFFTELLTAGDGAVRYDALLKAAGI